jgi:NAD(P)-dependent dehydrogenase (short-subunit alcohol dehydrogenase family)/acyl carrier protein
MTDTAGRPVASVESLVLRPVSAHGLRRQTGAPLYRTQWVPFSAEATTRPQVRWAVVGTEVAGLSDAPWFVEIDALCAALSDGVPVPDFVVTTLAFPAQADGSPAVAHWLARRALDLVQTWLAAEVLDKSCLVVRTAAGTGGADTVLDPATAVVWGLVRSAQAEHPDRIMLVDLDDEQPFLKDAVLDAHAEKEPELLIREDVAYVPRLVAAGGDGPSVADDRYLDGTVLITGGTGFLGGVVARHLVKAHGARHIVLAGRRGLAADGVAELLDELSAEGASVDVVACDVADRDEIASLLRGIPAEHPLVAIVHVAGVVDDGVVSELTADRLDTVLRPKVDAVVHLHELTLDCDLRSFVLFSSSAGMFGAAGQANYAAANSFLDAFAHLRRAKGLPAVSIAWGPWAGSDGMTAGLGETDLRRMARAGLTPLSVPDGLALLDAAQESSSAAVLAARLDLQKLDMAGHRMLRGLTRIGVQRPALAKAPSGTVLGGRLDHLSTVDRDTVLLDLVRLEIAKVLALPGSETIGAEREFKELGFDSLTAVDLRNRLKDATGLRLGATIVFDYPTPAALATHLRTLLFPAETDVPPVLAEFERWEASIGSRIGDERTRVALTRRLRILLARIDEHGKPAGSAADDLTSVDVDGLLRLIDDEFGDS